MKYFILVTTLFLTSVGFSQTGLKRTIDLSKEDTKVAFLAVGKPAMLKINGTGGKVKGLLEVENTLVKGSLNVPLQDMTTGIALRDEHMKKKYLETDKFPDATLQITDFKMEKDFFNSTGSQKNVPFKGKLTIHGVEKDVEGTADIESSDSLVLVQAKANTNITAHKIDLPSYLGVKVADEVAIQTELKIKKQ